MNRNHHTMAIPLDGFEALEVTHDLGLSWQQVNEQREAGHLAPTIVCFPNWEAVAADLELPACVPVFPLTMDTLYTFPMKLTGYLVGDDMIRDALKDERESRRPFSKAR